MELVDGSMEGEKVFHEASLPKTFNPPPNPNIGSTSSLPDIIQSGHLPALQEALHKHGAILLRGFPVDSPEAFSSVVSAFGWDEHPYRGAATRVKKADRVYTANETPLDLPINFHHEMALVVKEFCSKIFFFCLEPPPRGGQTAILRSDVVVEKMEEAVPGVMEKIHKDGIRITWIRSRELWQTLLRTDDVVEAGRRALEELACSSVEFNNDGTAEFLYGPMNPVREFRGRKVWFNPIFGYALDGRDPRFTFGDGTPIPPEAFDAYSRITQENCVDVNWQKGDVLLVDNHRVQHARRPGKPPRVVLVSVCK